MMYGDFSYPEFPGLEAHHYVETTGGGVLRHVITWVDGPTPAEFREKIQTVPRDSSSVTLRRELSKKTILLVLAFVHDKGVGTDTHQQFPLSEAFWDLIHHQSVENFFAQTPQHVLDRLEVLDTLVDDMDSLQETCSSRRTEERLNVAMADVARYWDDIDTIFFRDSPHTP